MRGRVGSHPGWTAVVGATVGLALATLALTWPVFRHPSTTVLDTESLYGGASILIQRDINLTMWALSWDTHALTTDPLHLFDANAFYPARYTLCLSEHMLGNAPLFAPLYLATGNPVLAHQAALLANFVLAGLAMGAYVLYWTRDRAAALAAAFLFAFAPYRLWQLGNLHVISIQYLPVVLLAVDAILDRRGGAAAPIALGVALVLSSFCSYYIGYAAFMLAGVYTLVGLMVRGRGSLGRLAPLGAALAVAAVVVALVTLPYLILQRSGTIPDYAQQGFVGLAFLGMLKYGPTGLLSYYLLPRRSGIPEFLTFTGMALAALAVVVRREHPRGALIAAGATGVVLGLGPYLITPFGHLIPLPYRLLVAVVPGFSAMRVPHRFGALATVATMALAGLGIAAARSRLAARGRTRAALLLPLLVVVLVTLEVRPRGLRAMPMATGPAVPASYRWLAEHGEGGALLELPTQAHNLYGESVYMYFSTFHWLPLVNGYTPYPPRTYVEIMEDVKGLPNPEALRAVLGRARLRWVLLHLDRVKLMQRAEWTAAFDGVLRRVAEFGADVLYEVP